MKRIIIYVVLIITFTALGIVGYINKPADLPNEKILNTKYYMYNTLTGEYEELEITSSEFNYKGTTLGIDNNCKKYDYTKNTGILKLECNKAFKLSLQNDILIININDNNYYFYIEQERSYKAEFERKFEKTISTYKLEGETKLKEKEISISDLKRIITQNKISYIYMKGKSCKDTCTLFNKEFLNFKNGENIYYLDTTKLKQEDINSLIKTYDNLPKDIKEYDKLNPQILIVGNKEIQDIVNIEIKGFDLTNTIENLNNYEVNNEQNN